MSVDQDLQVTILPYTIAGCSEHSGRYVAENIMVDNPQDQSSRWSGAHQPTNVKQWMLLKLDKLAVINHITFGKFHKPHPCNMKEFKLYVGLSEDNMTEVLHAGLKNDAFTEMFPIRNVNQAGLTFPSRFIRIEPLSAHGHSFHTSVWFVQLRGINDPSYVEDVKARHDEYHETVVLRLVLKHLRQRRMFSPLQNVLARTGLQLEHPSVSSLYEALVLHGNFEICEELLRSMATASLFSMSLLSSQPYSRWARIHAVDFDGDAPSARGGHAMCIDSINGRIYLFGGWDGQKNMDDFWVFDIKSGGWQVLSYAAQRELHGPGPRACHKLVFDAATGDIYFFGRLDDPGTNASETTDGPHGSGTAAPLPTPVSPPPAAASPPATTSSRSLPAPPWSIHSAEFYRYHTRGLRAGKWDLLATDTAMIGGPPLVFDHQMVIDHESQTIYVFGGRVVDGDWEALKYSGLYSYDIRANTWKVLPSPDSTDTRPSIPPRFGHSMVLDHITQTLFIFGGQRDEKYLSDMYTYHIPSNTVTELYHNFTAAGGPDACFTQRAVIDPDLREIYIFCGLTRRRPGQVTILDSDSPYWIYRYDRPERPGKWMKMLSPESGPFVPLEKPTGRYAHQVVYDPTTKTTYMHGGNASLEREVDEDGNNPPPESGATSEARPEELAERQEMSTEPDGVRDIRLDDLWQMTLIRPSADDIVRRGKSIIRQQRFRELCEDAAPLKALSYLQTDVSAVVDHSDPEEAKVFRALLAHLLAPSLPEPSVPITRKRIREESPVITTRPTDFEDEPMTATSSPARVASPMLDDTRKDTAAKTSLLSFDPDPNEVGENPPSASRFQQRTAVFEELMTSVNADARQPEKDLLLMINVDQSEV